MHTRYTHTNTLCEWRRRHLYIQIVNKQRKCMANYDYSLLLSVNARFDVDEKHDNNISKVSTNKFTAYKCKQILKIENSSRNDTLTCSIRKFFKRFSGFSSCVVRYACMEFVVYLKLSFDRNGQFVRFI